jgi:hypothetical protein
MESSKFTSFALKDLLKIGRNWRRLPALKSEAENQFKQTGLPLSERKDWVEEYVENKMPTSPQRLFQLIVQKHKSNLSLEFDVANLTELLGVKNLAEELQVVEEVLADCGLMKVEFLICEGSVKAEIK